MRWLTWMLVLGTAVLGTLVSVFNHQLVVLNYYWGVAEQPLSIMLILAFALGFLLASMLGAMQRLKLVWRNKRLQHKLARYQQQNSTAESQ